MAMKVTELDEDKDAVIVQFHLGKSLALSHSLVSWHCNHLMLNAALQ